MGHFALIGHPVAQSGSPRLFAAAYGGRHSYELLDGASFGPLWQTFLDRLDGINITAPYKLDAFRSVDHPSERSRLTGAVNLAVKTASGIAGYNTDVEGVIRSLREADQALSRALVIGCGGAGRAAAAGALELGCGVRLWNRTAEKASSLAWALGVAGSRGLGRCGNLHASGIRAHSFGAPLPGRESGPGSGIPKPATLPRSLPEIPLRQTLAALSGGRRLFAFHRRNTASGRNGKSFVEFRFFCVSCTAFCKLQLHKTQIVMALNKVMLIGNVGDDPKVRYLEPNPANPAAAPKVATFRLATSERFRDRSGELRENTEWHNIVAWRNSADLCEKFVRKGSQLFIEGKLRSRQWTDQNGGTRYVTEVVADSIQLLSRRQDGAQPSGEQPSAPQAAVPQVSSPQPQVTQTAQVAAAVTSAPDDDLPF